MAIRHAEPLRQLGQQPVPAPVVAPEGALELDAEAVWAKIWARRRATAAARAPAWRGDRRRAQPERQTSPAAWLERLRARLGSPSSGSGGRRLGPALGAQRRVGQCEAVSARQRFSRPARLAQEREMGAVIERQLRARDRPDTERLEGVRHLHGAVQAVVVCES